MSGREEGREEQEGEANKTLSISHELTSGLGQRVQATYVNFTVKLYMRLIWTVDCCQ